MNKAWIFLLVILLVSCTPNNPVKDVNYFVGTEGIVLTIPEKQKVTKILEDSELYSPLGIENLGAYDLDSYADNRYGYLTINYDNFYLSALKDFPLAIDPLYGKWTTIQAPDNTKIQVYPAPIFLKGKSNDYPIGEKLPLDFSYKVNKLQGQRESPETTIIYTLCYPYMTTFSKEACIDADPFSTDQRTKVCTSKEMLYSDGQGAPVAVTKVEPIMSKSGQIVSPTFRIFMRNEGKGSVLNYDKAAKKPIYELCDAAKMETLDWNKVHVSAELSGKALECTPETVYLKIDEDAYAVCKVQDKDLEFVPASNYKATLNVWLGYIYVQSATHQVEIIRG